MKIAMYWLFVFLLVKLLSDSDNSYSFSKPTEHLPMKIVFVIIIKVLSITFSKPTTILQSSLETDSKQIKKYLRAIDIETAQKLNLKPGQKLCRQCYERVVNNDNLNTEDML